MRLAFEIVFLPQGENHSAVSHNMWSCNSLTICGLAFPKALVSSSHPPLISSEINVLFYVMPTLLDWI